MEMGERCPTTRHSKKAVNSLLNKSRRALLLREEKVKKELVAPHATVDLRSMRNRRKQHEADKVKGGFVLSKSGN